MKKIVLLMVFCCLFAIPAMAQEKIVTIVNPPWPPYYEQSLPNYGVVPEIVSAAYARKGYTVKYEFMSLLSKLFKDVDSGIYDAGATAYYTEERAKSYYFSDSYMDSPVVFYKRKDAPAITWKTIEDLKPYKIVVLKNNSYSPEFDKADFLQKEDTISEKISFRKLYLKEADLAVMDRAVGYYLIQNALPDYQKDAFEIVNPPLYVNKLYLMFSKNAPDIKVKIEDFNSGLKEIAQDGTLNQILSKHGMEN